MLKDFASYYLSHSPQKLVIFLVIICFLLKAIVPFLLSYSSMLVPTLLLIGGCYIVYSGITNKDIKAVILGSCLATAGILFWKNDAKHIEQIRYASVLLALDVIFYEIHGVLMDNGITMYHNDKEVFVKAQDYFNGQFKRLGLPELNFKPGPFVSRYVPHHK